MLEILVRLLDVSGFPRRWDCGDWSPELGWLHIVSDVGIWSAYLTIPWVLFYFVHGRKNLPFRGIFVLFGAFILACGTTHLMDAVIFWWPAYRLAGVIKFVTACVSWAAVCGLVWIIPRALRMRSPDELEREIEERRRAEKDAARYAERLQFTNQRLIEAEQAKGDLIARVSHELRTPLTLILSPIESMLAGDRTAMNAADRESLRIVHNSAVRLLQMVTGLLDLSRLDSGAMTVQREELDALELTASILHDFGPIVKERRLTIGFEAAAGPLWALLDRYLYERIVFNLVSNAAKFTPQGGAITVDLGREGDVLRLVVKDTGIGISSGELPLLFEKYRQAEGSSSRRFEGAGLGLALVKEFAALLGGRVSVRSVPGQGSTFTVELLAPACEPVVGPARERQGLPIERGTIRPVEANQPPPRVEGKLRVLIAEDNPELARHILGLLEPEYCVAVAPDGQRAWELVRDWSPNLVLSDVMMPGLGGLDLCQAIKADPSTSRTPVILLTALIQRDALMRGWEVGADEYLFKPFHPRELLTRVRTLLRASEARHQVETVLANMSLELERRVQERTAELAAAHQKLQAADRQKDEFVATLAHELRNPLATARNCILVVRGGGHPPALVDEFLSMADRQTAHMGRLLDDLLDVARIRQGKITLRQGLHDLGELLEQAIADRRGQLSARSIELELSLPTEPILVSVDPVRFQQIVGNLLENAAKYSEEGQTVRVELKREPNWALIRVLDQGMGIAPEMIDRVFDAFVQDQSKTLHSRGGIGIGLSLVRKLVEMHGGTITARSEGPGQGAEFEVRLPYMVANEQPPRPHLRGGIGQSRLRISGRPRRRVLVVDDNVDSARSLAMLLTMAGQEVRTAYDGKTAIDTAESFEPELILLDIGMPEMDGYEVCRVLRTRTGCAEKTIVALTGWGQEEDRQRSRAAGFDRHLVKPVEPESIHELLDSLAPACPV